MRTNDAASVHVIRKRTRNIVIGQNQLNKAYSEHGIQFRELTNGTIIIIYKLF